MVAFTSQAGTDAASAQFAAPRLIRPLRQQPTMRMRSQKAEARSCVTLSHTRIRDAVRDAQGNKSRLREKGAQEEFILAVKQKIKFPCWPGLAPIAHKKSAARAAPKRIREMVLVKPTALPLSVRTEKETPLIRRQAQAGEIQAPHRQYQIDQD